MYTIKSEDLPDQLNQVDQLLSLVEVKGDSVISLFKARTILKGIFDLIKKDEKVNTEGEEEK